MSECPELRALALVRWQLFGSFTFRSEKLSARVRASMWLAFCRDVAKNVARESLYRLLWVCREERGEVGKRLHFHGLIGGLPSERVHIGTCFQCMRIWERVGGGHARVRVYDSNPDSLESALDYTTKGLAGDDAYETDKLNRAQLTLSESTRDMVRRLLARDRSVGTGEKSGPDGVSPG